jgi:hypothetical protein
MHNARVMTQPRKYLTTQRRCLCIDSPLCTERPITLGQLATKPSAGAQDVSDPCLAAPLRSSSPFQHKYGLFVSAIFHHSCDREERIKRIDQRCSFDWPSAPEDERSAHVHVLARTLTTTRVRCTLPTFNRTAPSTMPPKSGFSRAKNVGYDEDDIYDDYSEEEYAGEGEGEGEGMSEEDKAQMAAGVIKVREALGSEYKVKEVDIHDALWNYYYDIGKSVTFLKST